MLKKPQANGFCTIDTPMLPPGWALLERELIRLKTEAVEAFYDHYFDDRGFLLCIPRWGGDDGPDDAAENMRGWTVLHALGAPDIVLDLYQKGWEGHLRQYTEAKTTEVPFARDGMYYKEFPVMFDWMHNGEGFAMFFLEGLSNPYDKKFQDRMRRYAGFYMDEDPHAKNYDPRHKVIRSMFNGSRGPLMRPSTGIDWAGDPIEVVGRFDPGHGERSFEEMWAHFKDYNEVVGDHPLNLATTTLALNAYMIDHQAKYRDWTLAYIDAWVERTRANGGIIPTNIGLDGVIGGAADGKWYGGVYGWGFSVFSPQTGKMANRPYFEFRSFWGFGNALLLTGDQKYVDTWRGVIEGVNAYKKEIDGKTMYPRMHGDDGWYGYTPEPYGVGAEAIYYWSMDRKDLARLPMEGWIAFIEGRNPDFPEKALRADFAEMRARMEKMRQDTTTPDTRMSDDPNGITPVQVGNLVRLMLGGLANDPDGYPMHCRVRYFDPDRRRAGIPEDVAALVERMTADETVLTLVNVNPVAARTVIVQGGAYAEHQIESVAIDGRTTPVHASSFTVVLESGCGAQLTLKMRRYANPPTLVFPWDRD
ncbi:MAG: hypothetical protein FJY97_04305 [candidate division Zixibacteria bacterium]|nr:hypothetical protein [candidate division Zixibacteria bacterium]